MKGRRRLHAGKGKVSVHAPGSCDWQAHGQLTLGHKVVLAALRVQLRALRQGLPGGQRVGGCRGCGAGRRLLVEHPAGGVHNLHGVPATTLLGPALTAYLVRCQRASLQCRTTMHSAG